MNLTYLGNANDFWYKMTHRPSKATEIARIFQCNSRQKYAEFFTHLPLKKTNYCYTERRNTNTRAIPTI